MFGGVGAVDFAGYGSVALAPKVSASRSPTLLIRASAYSCYATTRHVHFIVRRKDGIMRTLSYSESRANYAKVLDSVTRDREEVIITRSGHEPAVIVSLADYESLQETAYLMRSPANARRLLDSMEELEAGKGTIRSLLDG